MAEYIGYCHRCRSLSVYFGDRRSCVRYDPVRGLCGYRVSFLWANHEIAQAVMAAFKIAGWDAAFAVWDEAGRPELAYDG